MFAPALRRHIGHRPFQNLQQRLLYALTGDIAGNRRVLVLAANLIDLVDVNNSLLALLHVSVGGLQQLQDDILDVFPDVSGFGQGGGVDNREGNLQDFRQGLRHQRFAGTRRANEENIGLLQFDIRIAQPVHVDAFAMVVNGHRQFLLGGLLPDHVLIQKFFYFQWFGDFIRSSRGGVYFVVLEDRVADGDTLVTNVGAGVVARRGDELSDYVLALMAKRTSQGIIGSGTLQAIFSSATAGREGDTIRPRPLSVSRTSTDFVTIITRTDSHSNVVQSWYQAIRRFCGRARTAN